MKSEGIVVLPAAIRLRLEARQRLDDVAHVFARDEPSDVDDHLGGRVDLERLACGASCRLVESASVSTAEGISAI